MAPLQPILPTSPADTGTLLRPGCLTSESHARPCVALCRKQWFLFRAFLLDAKGIQQQACSGWAGALDKGPASGATACHVPVSLPADLLRQLWLQAQINMSQQCTLGWQRLRGLAKAKRPSWHHREFQPTSNVALRTQLCPRLRSQDVCTGSFITHLRFGTA